MHAKTKTRKKLDGIRKNGKFGKVRINILSGFGTRNIFFSSRYTLCMHPKHKMPMFDL